MSEYYRIKNKQEWDWLMKRLDEKDKGIKWCSGTKFSKSV